MLSESMKQQTEVSASQTSERLVGRKFCKFRFLSTSENEERKSRIFQFQKLAPASKCRQ